MAKGRTTVRGMPPDPVVALRAHELVDEIRQLVAAARWKDAAPRSHALVQIAPGLAEAHDLMGLVAMRTGATGIAAGCFERAIAIGPATSGRFHSLGKALMVLLDRAGAEKALRRALLLRPGDVTILCDLGDVQLDQGRTGEALKTFRGALKKSPEHRYAAHMVAALGESATSDQKYVAGVFDDYADHFDEHLTRKLAYRVPEALAALAAPYGDFEAAIDLGCGTGLVAAALAGRVRAIDGIDLSRRMIEKARQRGLYRQLALGDCEDILRTDAAFAGPYDLVLAADVFIYVGALDGVISAAVARMTPGGVIAFSVETADGEGVQIRSSGRFAHTPAYIGDVAARNGLGIIAQAPHTIRLEQERPIAGFLYLLGRVSNA